MPGELLTTIIPTIGRGTLGRAIRSVKDQTEPTDLVVEMDERRTGCGPTLNRGLELVETPWVNTMGDDDVLHPQFTESLRRIVTVHKQDFDMVVFQMEYQWGMVLPREMDASKWYHGDVGCSYAIKTELAREIKWIDEPCQPGLGEDWEMIDEVRARGGIIHVAPVVRYYVRWHGQRL